MSSNLINTRSIHRLGSRNSGNARMYCLLLTPKSMCVYRVLVYSREKKRRACSIIMRATMNPNHRSCPYESPGIVALTDLRKGLWTAFRPTPCQFGFDIQTETYRCTHQKGQVMSLCWIVNLAGLNWRSLVHMPPLDLLDQGISA